MAPAAPPSLCISMTEGTSPQRFLRPCEAHWSAHSPIAEGGGVGEKGATSAQAVRDVGDGLVRVDDLVCVGHSLSRLDKATKLPGC